jgi:Asp/Glu/hydantoin racemase
VNEEKLDYGYGFDIGMITFEPPYPALIRGHPSNAKTFNFPILFRTLHISNLVDVLRGEKNSLPAFIEAAQELEAKGVKAITCNCGFLIVFQEALADAVNVPVFTSSLLQVPLVHKMLKKGKKVGIITANSVWLTEQVLRHAGIDSSIPIAIAGMEDAKEFYASILHPFSLEELKSAAILNPRMYELKFGGSYQKVKDEVVNVAKRLLSKDPEVRAIVLECTELTVYADAIREATNLPVFDLVSLINYVHDTVMKRTCIFYP